MACLQAFVVAVHAVSCVVQFLTNYFYSFVVIILDVEPVFK